MNELTTYSNNVTKLTTEIKVIQDNVCQGMIEIGKRLIEIKKELGHGNWESYLRNELKMSGNTAFKLMKVYTEFGDSNLRLISDLPSTKILSLLDVPQEHREDFIAKSNIEDSTVSELKKEIKKYKEENGLLSKKQQQALEEKRRVEQEKQRIQSELQREKSKPPVVETKVVEKVVEKVVDKTDYETLNKLKKLEEDNRRLVESKRVFEDAMNTYKKNSDEYQDFKDKMFKMSCVKGGSVDEVKALEDMNKLYVDINRFIKLELSPVQYEYCLNFIGRNEYIAESFINMINVVEDWCLDMRQKLDENNNIITVEVN